MSIYTTSKSARGKANIDGLTANYPNIKHAHKTNDFPPYKWPFLAAAWIAGAILLITLIIRTDNFEDELLD